MTRWLATLPLLAACQGGTADDGDDTDTDVGNTVVGLYETTLDAESPACGELVELTLPVPFLRLVEIEGGALQTWVCRSAEDCDDFSVDGYVYEPNATGWRSLTLWSYANTTDAEPYCALNARRQVLEERPNGKVRIDGEATSEILTDGALANDVACEAALDGWTPAWTGELQNCTRWEGRRIGD